MSSELDLAGLLGGMEGNTGGGLRMGEHIGGGLRMGENTGGGLGMGGHTGGGISREPSLEGSPAVFPVSFGAPSAAVAPSTGLQPQTVPRPMQQQPQQPQLLPRVNPAAAVAPSTALQPQIAPRPMQQQQLVTSTAQRPMPPPLQQHGSFPVDFGEAGWGAGFCGSAPLALAGGGPPTVCGGGAAPTRVNPLQTQALYRDNTGGGSFPASFASSSSSPTPPPAVQSTGGAAGLPTGGMGMGGGVLGFSPVTAPAQQQSAPGRPVPRDNTAGDKPADPFAGLLSM